MIRNLLATTALAGLIATGAYAQDTMAPAAPAEPMMTEDAAPIVRADGYLATQLIGGKVYNSTADDAQHIGDVNDIVIGPDGNIEAVVIGVGGFLGLGQKNVSMDFAQIDWAERDGDRWLVAPTTREQLEQQAEFDRRAYEPQPVQDLAASDPALAPVAPDTAVAPDTTAQAPLGTEMGTDPTTTAAIDRSTLTPLPAGEIRAQEMIGTTVYGSDEANVGSIGDVVLSADGQVDAYIIDVGGFLGMGTKEVAVGGDDLAFMTDSDGNKYLYTDFTKDQLDAAAAYDSGTYGDHREDQRLLAP